MDRITAILGLLLAVFLTGCYGVEDDNPSDPADYELNFDCLWRAVDQHYCFLDDKGIDWDSIGSAYRPAVAECKTRQQLFSLCASMLDELQDGHVNLSAPWATSYYRAWWSEWPADFDERVVLEHYLQFNYCQLGVFTYGYLPDGTGYIRCSSFVSGLGEGNIDYVLDYLGAAEGLIVDVRDNGGGALTNVEPLVRRFLRQRTLMGYLVHKTGPGHSDFAKPFPFHYDPTPIGHIAWGKPVCVVCNRSTYSAANNFVQAMAAIPGVKIIGARTGGGAGLAFSYSLPIGWGLRLSSAKILDADGRSTEYGIDPSPGFEIHITPEQTALGHDPILDTASLWLRGTTDDKRVSGTLRAARRRQ